MMGLNVVKTHGPVKASVRGFNQRIRKEKSIGRTGPHLYSKRAKANDLFADFQSTNIRVGVEYIELRAMMDDGLDSAHGATPKAARHDPSLIGASIFFRRLSGRISVHTSLM
jgi:hypothetical protein